MFLRTSLIILLFFNTFLFANYESGQIIFEKKCSSCHSGYISGKVIKENFFEKNNNMLHLTAPTVNMLAYALKDSSLHIGDKNDEEMQKFEILEFMNEYLYDPKKEDSVCDPTISIHYNKKESMRGKINKKEIIDIVDYLFEYKKRRVASAPTKYKIKTANFNTDKILKQAQDEKKVIVIEAMSESCYFCRKMKKDVFSKKDVQRALSKNFIFIEVDIDKVELPFGLRKNFQGITPSFFFLTSKSKLLNSYPGSWTKEDFLEILKENLE